jgi:Cell division protein CrgA
MPESRGRQRARRRPYVPPPPVKKRRQSPRWYGYVTLGFMAVGVIVIVWNYMRGDSADPSLLFVGLGFIAVGFALATRWR